MWKCSLLCQFAIKRCWIRDTNTRFQNLRNQPAYQLWHRFYFCDVFPSPFRLQTIFSHLLSHLFANWNNALTFPGLTFDLIMEHEFWYACFPYFEQVLWNSQVQFFSSRKYKYLVHIFSICYEYFLVNRRPIGLQTLPPAFLKTLLHVSSSIALFSGNRCSCPYRTSFGEFIWIIKLYFRSCFLFCLNSKVLSMPWSILPSNP